jgi:hypothetical protein
MNPVLVCLGAFILMSFLSTLLFVAASMNSSRISQSEEGAQATHEAEPEPGFEGRPLWFSSERQKP